MIINTMISEILEIVLSFILSFAYFYLTELLLILIISPIILLIATLSSSMSNKTKIFILSLNIFYSFLFLPIIYSLLLSVIRNYEMLLNNMYMTSYFSIFSPILTEIYGNIGAFIVIYVIISILMIILYIFNVIPNLKEYINNNKRFFIETLTISLISGLLLLFFILPTNFSYFIYIFILSILLIAAILSYIRLFNQKNIKEILYKLSENDIDKIVLWSSILLLSFLKVIKSIANIFALYSISYQLVTYIVAAITILLLMLVMSLYVYIVNTYRNLKNMIDWLILAILSISLLTVYLFGNGSIWYIIIGILSFSILISIYLHIHFSCNLKNINKKDWNDILNIVLALYTLSFAILYPIIEVLEVLYVAIIFVCLTIIPLFIYCHRINKEKDHNKQ
jgi:hypothetical protein